MMTFIMLTCSFTVAILLAGVISTVAIFAAMQSPKILKWFTAYYMKQVSKTVEAFGDIDFDEVEGL